MTTIFIAVLYGTHGWSVVNHHDLAILMNSIQNGYYGQNYVVYRFQKNDENITMVEIARKVSI